MVFQRPFIKYLHTNLVMVIKNIQIELAQQIFMFLKIAACIKFQVSSSTVKWKKDKANTEIC